MKLKLDEQNHVVVKDGQPVYVYDDGKERPFDAAGTVATISRLNGEAKGHRERAEAAEGKLQDFAAITDVPAALAAIETVGKLNAKELIAAGEVDRVKADMQKAFDQKAAQIEEKYRPVVKRNKELETALVNEKVGGAFANSKFITDKMAIPADLVRARFGERFKLEDGKVIATDGDGKPLLSRAKPGNIADFDEAIEIMVDEYPYRDSIMKGTGASGGGARGGNGANGAGKSLPRAAFDALDPAARMAHIQAKGVVVDA